MHIVASGDMHSPVGRQSIAMACNSRNKGSSDLDIWSSVAANQGFPFPRERKKSFNKLLKSKFYKPESNILHGNYTTKEQNSE